MKLSLLSILLFLVLTSSAQEGNELETIKKHELRFNALNFVAFKKIDFSYEYLFNDEISSGISVLKKYGKIRDLDFFYVQDYAITPYFRCQFPYPVAFFDNILMTAEVFTMIHGGTYYPNINRKKGTDYNNVALGFSLGQKMVSQSGFVLDSYLGIGRNIKEELGNEVVLRMGISFGYQF